MARRIAGIALAMVIITTRMQASAHGEPQPPKPIPPRQECEFLLVVKKPTTDNIEVMKETIEDARNHAEGPYSWFDAYLYAAAVAASTIDDVGAREFAEQCVVEYLDRVHVVEDDQAIPSFMATDGCYRDAKRAVAKHGETMMKRWEGQRWSLHFFEPDQIGNEYQSAISLRCLLANNATELDMFLAEIEEHTDAFFTKARHKKSDLRSATADIARFWAAIRYRQLGVENESKKLLDDLENSRCNRPVPIDLLMRCNARPTVLLGFRVRSLIVAIALVCTLGIVLAAFRRNHLKKREEHRRHEEIRSCEFAIHKSEPFALIALHWLGLMPFRASILAVMFVGGSLAMLAWSEEVFWQEGFVVDRDFLDYYSFAYGYAILVPALLAITLGLYAAIPRYLPGALAVSFACETSDACEPAPPEATRRLWKKYADVCNSRSLTTACLVTSLLIVSSQKYQWSGDPGTAWVDLRYPDQWSVTAVYFTVATFFVYYAFLSCLIRAGLMLWFIGSVYSHNWCLRNGLTFAFNPNHADRCAGMRPLGWLMLLAYLPLLLLMAQIILNMVEKLRFYESIDIVLAHTSVSVWAFGVAFFLCAPAVIGRPLIAVHRAMREFRWRECLELTGTMQAQRTALLDKVKQGTPRESEVEGYKAVRLVIEDVRRMPLWPVDVKIVTTLVASHFIPIGSVIIPFVKQAITGGE